MASPIGVGDALAIIDKCLLIYQKIKDAPGQVEQVKERMQSLKSYVKRLETFVKDQNGLSKIKPELIEEIQQILAKVKSDSEKVYQIFDKWQKKQGPAGLQFRFALIADVLFALGSSPKELQDLSDKLDRRLAEISQWISLLSAAGINALLTAKSPGRTPSKSPARSPGRMDYSIIFVDSYNEGRSIVSQAYAELVREWTVRTNHKWKISKIHSAGLLVKSRNDMVALQESFRMNMTPGGTKPMDIALTALFDAPTFKFPYKDSIRSRVSAQTSRGITSSIFTTYDFIILFNRIDAANLERVKEALPQTPGVKRKARMVFLGDYGTQKKSEIWNPPRQANGSFSREEWNKTVSTIKVSFKGFLKKEMGWIQPPPGAKQN